MPHPPVVDTVTAAHLKTCMPQILKPSFDCVVAASFALRQMCHALMLLAIGLHRLQHYAFDRAYMPGHTSRVRCKHTETAQVAKKTH